MRTVYVVSITDDWDVVQYRRLFSNREAAEKHFHETYENEKERLGEPIDEGKLGVEWYRETLRLTTEEVYDE